MTEACFQAHPLDFDVKEQGIVFDNGTVVPVPNPIFVNEGTFPQGSMWSMLPIPSTALGRTYLHLNINSACYFVVLLVVNCTRN